MIVFETRMDKWGRETRVQTSDTMKDQQESDRQITETWNPGNPFGLLIWPDLDIFVIFDREGYPIQDSAHEVDENGQIKTSQFDCHDIGVNRFHDLRKAAGPGGLITNTEFVKRAQEYGYDAQREFDWIYSI